MRIAVLVLVLCAAAWAQQKLSLLEKMAQPKLSVQSAFLADAKLKGYEGSVRTYKQEVQVNNGFGGLSYARWDFDWNDAQTLPFYRGKTPIGHMQRVKLYGNLFHRFNDRWIMLASVNANASFEKEYDGALGAGVFGFFSYKIDEDHSLQLGAFANYHPVTTLALPVVGYSYRAREDDGFQLVLGFPRAYAGYHLAKGVLLNAGFIYSQAVICLADDSGIEPAGYVEAQDYQGNAGVRYSFGDAWQLNVDVLYAFRRDFTVYDSGAHRVDHYSIDPSFGAMLKLRYAF